MNKFVGIPRRDGISKTLQVERLVWRWCTREIEFKHLNKWSFELKKLLYLFQAESTKPSNQSLPLFPSFYSHAALFDFGEIHVNKIQWMVIPWIAALQHVNRKPVMVKGFLVVTVSDWEVNPQVIFDM